jgi:predicted HTH transcriptional regulator
MINITPKYISRIIAGDESQTVEFKSSMPSNTIIMKVLSAFANTDGGILLIGVKDRDEIVGVPNEEIEKIKSRIRNIELAPI